ncbi:MAG: polysaccharide deacetylase family protein [Methylococcales bacterium]
MKAVITFHSIDDSGSVISFPCDAFRSFIDALARSELRCCELDSLLDPGTDQGIAITFDDGMESVYSNALPIMREYGVKAHLFLTTGVVGKTNRWPGNPPLAPEFKMLDWTQIEACHSGGFFIESHTHRHSDLRRLQRDGLRIECESSDAIIEQKIGRRPRYFAYPYGFHDENTRNFMRNRYRGSFTTELRDLKAGDDPSALPRLDSFYLKPAFLHRRLNSPLTRSYLRFRGLLRSIRGSQ